VVEVGNAFDRLGSSILEAGFGDAFDNASAGLVDFLGKLDSAVKKTESFLRKSDSVFALAFRGSTIGEAFGYERSAADMDKISEIRGYATGGIDIRGPGTGTSDSILARISNGESVITAAATSFWGPDFMNAVNNMAMPPEFGAIPSALAEAGGPSRGPMVALPIQGPDGVYEGQFDPDTAERLERDMRKRAKTKSIRSPAFTRRRYGQ